VIPATVRSLGGRKQGTGSLAFQADAEAAGMARKAAIEMASSVRRVRFMAGFLSSRRLI